MSENERERPIRRILAALDASPPSFAALDLAAALAAAVDAELEGLFVEDMRLFRLAEIPCIRGVGSFSGTVRPLDLTSVVLHLRAQAGLARRAVAASAGKAGVRWSFRVVQGRVADVLVESAATADLVSLGRIGWSPRTPGRIGTTARAVLSAARSTAMALSALRPGQPVCVVYDGSAAARRALRLAAALVDHHPGALVVLLAAESEADADRLRQEARVCIEPSLRARISFRLLIAESPKKLLHRIELEATGMLVLPAAAWLDDESFLTLLQRIAHPVLRVG